MKKKETSYFGSIIQNIIDKLIILRINGNGVSDENKLKFKQVIQILEEARINADNNKFFDITKAIEIYPDYWAFDDIMKSLKEIAVLSYNDFHCITVNTLSNHIKNMDEDLIDYYVDFIANFNELDIYEELVNYVLSDLKFDKNIKYIEVEGESVKDFYINNDFNIIESYLSLINKYHKLKNWNKEHAC